MATTNIEADIANITGATANAQFIKTAQKFVVASIPKDLMLWAGTSTAPVTHGGDDSPTAVTLPQPTDSIIDVVRNGFSAEQVPESMQGFIANSSSLHLATATFPKYYIQAGNKVIVNPVPTSGATVLVNYVDFLKVDDDCDLRGAVVFHASSQEFEKLATSKVSDWSDLTLPVSPSAPSFGSDLSITAVPPSVPTLGSSSVSFSTSTPVYVKPTTPSQTAFSSYTSGLSETDPGIFSIASVPPPIPSSPSFTTPTIGSITVASTTLSNIGVPPIYTTPVVGGDAAELSSLDDLDSDNTIDVLLDQPEWDQWFATAAHFIEDEEDTELAAAQLQKISAYIQAYSGAMQNQLNIFNDANAEYQGKLQEATQQAQINAQKAQAQAQIDATDAQQETSLLLQKENQEYAASLQKFSAEVQEYQANVSKEVQEYGQKLSQYQLELNTSFQAWSKTESDNLAKYQGDIQNELNSFNDANVEYQAQLQISIQNAQLDSQDDAQKIQKYGSELQSYQNIMNKEVQSYSNSLQKNAQEYQNKLALYDADLQKYQAEVGEKSQKITSSSQNAVYYANESKKYYEWAITEINMYIQNNSKMISTTMAAQAAQQQRR
jgi:hypothetical protein